nr:EOG090X04D9 [Eulimnadia texana]
MEQYLHAVKMAVDQDQYQVTSKLVEEFLSPQGCGHKLQEILVEKQQKEDNWAYDWWLNDMYMNNPLSLPINSNPGMVFPRMEEVRDLPSFLTNVAHFISGILDYKELIDRQLLTQDRAASREKGQPLCMSQYKRLFTSYRVPGEESDYLKSVTADCSGLNEHIVVAHKGQFWRLDVVNKGQRMPAEELAFNLNAIIEDGQKLDPFNDTPTQLHLLRKAVEFQTNVMINNILGQGLDIHLLGLREVAKATENQKALQLFLDPSYAAINHFALSTSQIPTTSDSFMGYGPVVPDGYGASYNPQETSIIFCISSFHSCEEKNTRSFIASLSASLQEMKKLLENNDLKTY